MELILHHPSHPTFIRTLLHTSTKTLYYSSRLVGGSRRFFLVIGWSVRAVSGMTETRATVIRAI